MRRCTAWPEHSPFWACLSTVLASSAHSTCGLCRCDDASITPSFVIHSHLLDGIATSVCSLPPFLPASDPRLPNARLGMVLLLHHLESKSFTYRDTQLSRYNDLAAHPPVLPVSSERVAHTACRRTVCHVPFRGIFSLENISPFRQPVLVATRPLTLTVGWLLHVQRFKINAALCDDLQYP